MARFTCNFISYTLDRAVDITVVVPSVTMPEIFPGTGEPPKHTKKDKYPVLYLLHGLGNNHATWCGYTNIELYAEERNMAVVMISGENRMYMDAGQWDKFYTFIQEELPDFVTGMFPVSKKPEDTYIAGLSMGGFGTQIHGYNNPDKYAAMGIFSAGLFLPPNMEVPEEKYDPMKALENMVSKGYKKKIFLACGEKDHLYEDCKKTKLILEEKEQDLTWLSIPDYKHEWRFWDIAVERFLDWIPRTDSFIPDGGKRGI